MQMQALHSFGVALRSSAQAVHSSDGVDHTVASTLDLTVVDHRLAFVCVVREKKGGNLFH